MEDEFFVDNLFIYIEKEIAENFSVIQLLMSSRIRKRTNDNNYYFFI